MRVFLIQVDGFDIGSAAYQLDPALYLLLGLVDVLLMDIYIFLLLHFIDVLLVSGSFVFSLLLRERFFLEDQKVTGHVLIVKEWRGDIFIFRVITKSGCSIVDEFKVKEVEVFSL